ncbi:hypothetical protein HUJ04_005802 [Dendroctonus ponderosae]|nr:hypothetical protein HUJ04_005802 [Dendroctonus ponderosae]
MVGLCTTVKFTVDDGMHCGALQWPKTVLWIIARRVAESPQSGTPGKGQFSAVFNEDSNAQLAYFDQDCQKMLTQGGGNLQLFSTSNCSLPALSYEVEVMVSTATNVANLGTNSNAEVPFLGSFGTLQPAGTGAFLQFAKRKQSAHSAPGLTQLEASCINHRQRFQLGKASKRGKVNRAAAMDGRLTERRSARPRMT